MANLRAVAEAAKIKLSSEERVVVRMPVGGGIEAVLTRQVRCTAGSWQLPVYLRQGKPTASLDCPAGVAASCPG